MSQSVEVEVREQVLHVGDSAYPVKNIARIRIEKKNPDKKRLWRLYWKSVGKRLLAGAVVALVLSIIGTFIAVSGGIVVAGFLILKDTLELREVLEQEYHVLVVETTGDPFASLLSSDKSAMEKLKGMLVEAINNPSAYFNVTFNTHNGDNIFGDNKIFGDEVKTYGPNSPGKVVK